MSRLSSYIYLNSNMSTFFEIMGESSQVWLFLYVAIQFSQQSKNWQSFPPYMSINWHIIILTILHGQLIDCVSVSSSLDSILVHWSVCLFLCQDHTVLITVALYYSTEKAMAPHSSTLAWKIPWTEGPGRLQSMGSLRVRHDRATSLSLFTFMHWRKKWQPTPVFLLGESQGRGSLVGCRLWGRTESDTTEVT